jgi:hypothetical protein
MVGEKMSLNNVEDLLKNLDFKVPIEVQESAYKALRGIECLDTSKLINWSMKGTWHNIVPLIGEIGYPKNKEAIPSLLGLLRDMNWAGSWQAIEILKMAGITVLIPHIEMSLKDAYLIEDYVWISGIKCLVEELELSGQQFIEKEVYDILEYAEW